mgnify:CR=1 FL=1
MPHLSSIELDKKLSDKLFNDLLDILNRSKKVELMTGVINELLTETEKLMLAKRIAIVLLLNANTPQSSIADILKVSTSTIAKTSLKMEQGRYHFILNASKKDKNDFERIIYDIMTVGGLMRPKVGRKYWRKYSTE